jgi:hypothetical protein
MAISTHGNPGVVSKNSVFQAKHRVHEAGPRVPAYRCQCCGADVTYDSLAACCECSEESYVERWSAPNLRSVTAVLATSA